MTVRRFVAVLALAAALAPAAPATESVNGRWAADADACRESGRTPERSPLVITGSGIRWLNDDCRIARTYKTGDTVHLQAVCRGLAGDRRIAVSLRRHRDRLLVRWDRGRPGELRRCP